MANIWFAGAECGDASEMTFSYLSLSNTCRTGSYSFSTWYAVDALYKTFDSSYSELFIQFAWKHDNSYSGQSIFKWQSDTAVLGTLTVNASNRVDAYTGDKSSQVGTGSRNLSVGGWNIIELHISIADAGTIETKINGTSDISFSGDTKPGSETSINRLSWLNNGGANFQYIDDIVVNDPTGTINNSWPNAARIIRIYPSADGAVHQWSCSSGSDHYALIDEVPPSSSDYVTSTTIDQVDEFVLSNLPAEAKTIYAVRPYAFAVKENSDAPNQIALGVKVGTTNYMSTDLDLGVSYGVVRSLWETNPLTNAQWASTEVDDLQLVLQSRSQEGGDNSG